MKLQALKEKIITSTHEAMKEAINNGRKGAGAMVDSEAACIDLFITANDCVEAVVTHYGKLNKVSSRLEAWCENVLRELSWRKVEDEVKAENAETPEQEYARRGEAMFARSMQWHRIR